MYGDDNMNYHIMLSLHGMHLPQVHFTYVYWKLQIVFLGIPYNIMLWGTLHVMWQ